MGYLYTASFPGAQLVSLVRQLHLLWLVESVVCLVDVRHHTGELLLRLVAEPPRGWTTRTILDGDRRCGLQSVRIKKAWVSGMA